MPVKDTSFRRKGYTELKTPAGPRKSGSMIMIAAAPWNNYQMSHWLFPQWFFVHIWNWLAPLTPQHRTVALQWQRNCQHGECTIILYLCFGNGFFSPFSDSSDLILQLSRICCRAHIGSVSFSLPAGRCSMRTSNDVHCLSLQVLMKISLFPSAMGPPLSCSLPNKPLVCVDRHCTEITGNESTS